MTGVIHGRAPRAHARRMARTTPRLPLHPKNPDRVCWGCDKYCADNDLACGNGTIRTPHPAELFGSDWLEFFDGRPRVRTDDSDR